ncbi:unnamed protein product [Albugo candida]|uniref:Uncharacterized protein n=1 Tax=Albugo candida TaxID=65357 RepID=A0A024FY24_9STRA|nr:unnamed protein product [Albugo candida]|eukprot:CCI11554.1 unnamed protein product [Albugo candida]
MCKLQTFSYIFHNFKYRSDYLVYFSFFFNFARVIFVLVYKPYFFNVWCIIHIFLTFGIKSILFKLLRLQVSILTLNLINECEDRYLEIFLWLSPSSPIELHSNAGQSFTTISKCGPFLVNMNGSRNQSVPS